MSRPDAFIAFSRIYSNANSGLEEWIVEANEVLRPNEQLFIRFAKVTGLRLGEAICSFNLIIELSHKNRLNEYVNEENGIIEHFRFKAQFLRDTKNVFISIVPKELISEVEGSQPLPVLKF